MTVFTNKQILSVAKTITTNVKNEYKLGKSAKWSYYLAKAILNPKKNISRIGVNDAPNPQGTSISRTVSKADYLDIVRRYVKFVEKDKNHRLPNYVSYGKHKIRPRLATLVFAKILVSYTKNNKLPSQVNINSKAFTKPVETTNEVYNAFIKKFGNVKTIDGALQIISDKFDYEFYFDDKKSNLQVIKDKAGNCTDLTQMLANIGEALGYEVKCVHVQCRTSGTGHVFLKLKHKKHTSNSWITRDPSAVCNGNDIKNIWCSNGIVLGEDSSWWLENKYR